MPSCSLVICINSKVSFFAYFCILIFILLPLVYYFALIHYLKHCMNMDIFEYRATRVVNTNGVFEVYKEEEGDLGGLFMRLKNLTVSEMRTQWDIAYLDTYIYIIKQHASQKPQMGGQPPKKVISS